MTTKRVALLLTLSMGLPGCFAPIVEGARQGADAAKRGSLQASAEAGDAESQYKLGKTYCCESGVGIQKSASVYDNELATGWLCKSARQNYGPAQYELALIYAGEHSSGIGLLAKAKGLLTEEALALPVAATYASLALRNGVQDAASLKQKINTKLTPEQQAAQTQSLATWADAPCSWGEVIGQR